MCPPAFVMDSVVLICRDRPRTAATEGVPSQDKRGGLSLRWAEAGCAMVSHGPHMGSLKKPDAAQSPSSSCATRRCAGALTKDERRKNGFRLKAGMTIKSAFTSCSDSPSSGPPHRPRPLTVAVACPLRTPLPGRLHTPAHEMIAFPTSPRGLLKKSSLPHPE